MTKTNCTSAKTKAQAKHEKYLARALKIHGDKYDYSLAFFSSSTTRVKIKCKTCATVFTPTVNNHLNSKSGCPSCNKGATAPLTKVEYIKKARKKHGDKYDYSAVQYRGFIAKINIICPKHGPFTQTAAQHLRCGCTDCGKEKAAELLAERNAEVKFTGADFERESRKIYGDLLEYDHSSFISTKKPVRLKCKTHGWFETNAHSHLYSKPSTPCPDCRAGKLTPAQIRKAISLKHGRKYKYEGNAGNKSPREKITVVCRDHGPQLRILGTLLKGQPCPECEAEKRTRKKTEDLKKMERLREARRLRKEDNFIKRAKKKHKGFYKYDPQAMGFINLSTKINIECPKHGPFSQAPSQHLKAGCPKCAEERTSGWTKKAYIKKAEYANDGRAMLYLIRLTSETEEFYKIGITCKPTVNARFSKKDDLTGIYEIEVVRTVKGDAGFIYDAEKQFHRMNKKHRYKPAKYFAGHTECFSEITDDVRFLLDVI